MGEALEVATKFYDCFKAGDVDGADSLFADDCKFVMPMGPLTKAEHRGLAEAFLGAFPDAHMDVTHSIEGDGEVFVEGSFKGTHTGDMVSPEGTIPASGKTIDLPFADYFGVKGGKVVNHRTYWDQATLMGQIGATPPG
jgi:steroid delta-isomerase-like uncharacterized protein